MKFLSKVVLPLSTFVLGLLAGGCLLYAYGKDSLLILRGLQPIKYIIWESEEANEVYRSGNRDVARFALEHNVKILECYSKEDAIASWGATSDLALTYGRLAKLAEADGDQKRAEALFKQGAETFGKSMKSGTCTPERFRRIVDKADSVHNARTFPTFASMFEDMSTGKRKQSR